MLYTLYPFACLNRTNTLGAVHHTDRREPGSVLHSGARPETVGVTNTDRKRKEFCTARCRSWRKTETEQSVRNPDFRNWNLLSNNMLKWLRENP